MIDKLGMGGTQRQLVMLANRLKELQSGDITVICVVSPGPLAAEFAPGIDVISLGLRRSYGIKAMGQIWRMRQLLRDRRIDLVHAFLPSANIFAAGLRALTGVPAIASRRDVGIYPGRLWQRIEEKFAFRLVNYVTCVSGEIRTLLLTREPELANKTVVIPNAIDLLAADSFADAAPRSNPAQPYAIAVGNIKPVKGYDVLLAAAPKLDLKVIVVGSGVDLARHREFVHAHSLDAKVEFVGPKSFQETAGLVRGAAFAVHPSYSEGMSNAILEYMGHGKAVVCRDLATNQELVTDGRTGFLFKSVDDFVDRANALAQDVRLRESMGAAARRWIHDHHELTAVIERYRALYRNVLGSDA